MDECEQIRIGHFSDQNFLDSFRLDLAGCCQEAILFSPFLAPARAIHYYPVFQMISSRNATIRIFTRPRYEQPESLQTSYEAVESGLKRAGARIYKRVGMHEKIGIIDKHILWHGSLNILSHNDSLESMLRIESSALVEIVLSDLDLGELESKESSEPDILIKESELYKDEGEERKCCSSCQGAMILFAQERLWICENSPLCKNVIPISGSDENEKRNMGFDVKRLPISCPICFEQLEYRRGLMNRIVCSSDTCHFAMDPRLSSGLLRVLNRS